MSSSEPDLSLRIAERVREMRAARGWSLEVLAEKSGVSRSMISLIERAETSATAVVLDRIASALGCPITAFFEGEATPASPHSKREEQSIWRDPESGYVRRMLSPENFTSPIDLIEVTFPAGARVAYAATPGRELHQQIWIVSGAMEVQVGDVKYSLSAGDCLATKVGESIIYTNPHVKQARYIVALISGDRK
ncbi:MAG: XRE family transcriptional regulator [Burkholderiales bacterium]|nr:MAG: XRE family transcriptional regulator [Betaproteobacteria bacterium]TAG83794.1 MAG: XRE family transcriptional regulator [Burkholderiales bacterium]